MSFWATSVDWPTLHWSLKGVNKLWEVLKLCMIVKWNNTDFHLKLTFVFQIFNVYLLVRKKRQRAKRQSQRGNSRRFSHTAYWWMAFGDLLEFRWCFVNKFVPPPKPNLRLEISSGPSVRPSVSCLSLFGFDWDGNERRRFPPLARFALVTWWNKPTDRSIEVRSWGQKTVQRALFSPFSLCRTNDGHCI